MPIAMISSSRSSLVSKGYMSRTSQFRQGKEAGIADTGSSHCPGQAVLQSIQQISARRYQAGSRSTQDGYTSARLRLKIQPATIRSPIRVHQPQATARIRNRTNGLWPAGIQGRSDQQPATVPGILTTLLAASGNISTTPGSSLEGIQLARYSYQPQLACVYIWINDRDQRHSRYLESANLLCFGVLLTTVTAHTSGNRLDLLFAIQLGINDMVATSSQFYLLLSYNK